ncbi:outer membrane beta-barrel protein [Mucilaginibacter calamicampi]|uniref:Outer membrane beta-barrel protein n=1 Tax=Mucilaginibacter calamicampi TaxID=1302352 RepID=A0ABW2YVQ3_9SPHI
MLIRSFKCPVAVIGFLLLRMAAYAQSADTLKTDTVKTHNKTLQEVNIIAKPPLVRMEQGKMIVDVAASATNVGATVLEVLEKSPGVTVDRNGGIALQGKTGVLVLIDNKPTYLSGSELNNLLSSMNSAQVAQIELITSPTARYDASGNAGIINIKTKKTKEKGFNGNFTVAGGHGVYPKNNNSLVLNYRTGKVNLFLNYSMNYTEYLTDLYALRKYFDAQNKVVSQLDQPGYFSGTFLNNTVKAGLDYNLSSKTTIGVVLGGTKVKRQGFNRSVATWLSPAGVTDSAIYTDNSSGSRFKNGSLNLNLRHTISDRQDVSADFDWLGYDIQSDQAFDNRRSGAQGYSQQSRGNIPSTIKILSGKADYTYRLPKDATLQAGWKSSSTHTDNLALYQNFKNGNWVADNIKSNHFLYNESIHALYASIEKKYKKISFQAGLRYENTGYSGHQLGNAVQKDSSFSRNYNGLFPSGCITYAADSLNSFTINVGRRIDRPNFQNLNPFYFIINKYTYQTGNPFLLPQYTWNFELSHQYKSLLTTTVSYSSIDNYFSQLFLADKEKGILLYTQGNVGHTYTIGVTETVVASPFKWWSVTAQAVYNYKQLRGFNGNTYTSDINQLSISANNQFTIAKIYTAELSGAYTTRARNDVQELLYPTGQLSAGIARPVLKKRATLRFTARDVLYSNIMHGLTQFPNAEEYFKMKRDTRVVTLSFTYRFGKAYKTNRRSEGSAGDEAQRVGNG